MAVQSGVCLPVSPRQVGSLSSLPSCLGAVGAPVRAGQVCWEVPWFAAMLCQLALPWRW